MHYMIVVFNADDTQQFSSWRDECCLLTVSVFLCFNPSLWAASENHLLENKGEGVVNRNMNILSTLWTDQKFALWHYLQLLWWCKHEPFLEPHFHEALHTLCISHITENDHHASLLLLTVINKIKVKNKCYLKQFVIKVTNFACLIKRIQSATLYQELPPSLQLWWAYLEMTASHDSNRTESETESF